MCRGRRSSKGSLFSFGWLPLDMGFSMASISPLVKPVGTHTSGKYTRGGILHILTFVVRVPDAEMAGLGFNSQVGHLQTWDFSWRRSQSNCSSQFERRLGTLLPISLRWLECVDDELLALAVKMLFLLSCTRLAVLPVITCMSCAGNCDGMGHNETIWS